MIVTLKNIGPIHEASFDLDKDLIVFIGPNNTGKTYAAYCLYGLNKNNLNRFSVEICDQILPNIDKLFSNDKLDIVIDEKFILENKQYIFDEFSKQQVELLPALFALESNDFFLTEIKFENHASDILNKLIEKTGHEKYGDDDDVIRFSFIKQQNVSPVLRIEILSDELRLRNNDEEIIHKIKERFLNIISNDFVNLTNFYFIPAERIGISVFGKDIFKNRFSRTNEILKDGHLSREEKTNQMLKEFNTYSTIIQNSLEKYSDLTRTHTTFFATESIVFLADEFETKLLKGKISTNQDGDVFFTTPNKKEINLQASSSTIKSLTMLVLYLRYSARSGQTLIIDEPELNLHPDNQRLVARILAKLSKLGVKVIVSTHSDYFIRELNNLMMLYKEHPETQALRKKYGYEESELLDYKRVGASLAF